MAVRQIEEWVHWDLLTQGGQRVELFGVDVDWVEEGCDDMIEMDVQSLEVCQICVCLEVRQGSHWQDIMSTCLLILFLFIFLLLLILLFFLLFILFLSILFFILFFWLFVFLEMRDL